MSSLADRIDAVLPQTQCRRCGFAGCRPYAEAVAAGTADIDRCPPGGSATAAGMARLLGRRPKPLDPACGPPGAHAVAVIDEQWCIGCALCLRVCPVDAIVGAVRQMHTVLESECTGCGLCVDPCPVDCIAMMAQADAWPARVAAGEPAARRRARAARRRHRLRSARLAGKPAPRAAEAGPGPAPPAALPDSAAARRAVVAAAVARVRTRRRARRDAPRGD